MKTIRSLTCSLLAAWPALLCAGPGGPVASLLTAPAYTLHEWGTFTTVSASDGTMLPGLHREEESLPPFVYAHEGMGQEFSMSLSKGWHRPLANVTVKMETPVIYFYTDQPFKAKVRVWFRGGSISQWFPQRSEGETPPPLKRNAKGQLLGAENTLDFAKSYKGSVAWNVDVVPAADNAFGAVFKGSETMNWVYPRQTDSALVKNEKGETEKYLFYRGVGNFGLPVVFTCASDGTLKIRNNSDSAIPGLFVFHTPDGTDAGFDKLGPIQPSSEITTNINALKLQKEWKSSVYDAGASLLTEAGLFRKEADAMMQTWWHSYFQRSGTRVFWIVPESITEKILPLEATPAPAKTVRVLVGRSEIMTPAFEQRLVADFAAKPNENLWVHDRYFLAYQARIEQMTRAAATPQPGTQKQAAAPTEALPWRDKFGPPQNQVKKQAAAPSPDATGDEFVHGTTGITPLMRAALEGDAYIVHQLIKQGADVNARTSDVSSSGAHVGGLTALMLAAGRGHAETVRLLLASGARVDEKSANDQTALSRAVFAPEESGKIPAVTALLEAGADPGASRPKNLPLTEIAQSQGQDQIATLLKWHSMR